jgi:hypothetical protein
MTKEEGPLDFLEKKATITCRQLNSDKNQPTTPIWLLQSIPTY